MLNKADLTQSSLKPNSTRRREVDSKLRRRVLFVEPDEGLKEQAAGEDTRITPPQTLLLEEQRLELVKMRVKLEMRREILMEKWFEEQRKQATLKGQSAERATGQRLAVQLVNFMRPPNNARAKSYSGPAA